MFGRYVTQTVYTAHIDDNGPGGVDSRVCHGRECFAQTHLMILGSCCLGLASQALVAWRTRALYRGIWRHQHGQEQK